MKRYATIASAALVVGIFNTITAYWVHSLNIYFWGATNSHDWYDVAVYSFGGAFIALVWRT